MPSHKIAFKILLCFPPDTFKISLTIVLPANLIRSVMNHKIDMYSSVTKNPPTCITHTCLLFSQSVNFRNDYV